jgi:hypothetical protein
MALFLAERIVRRPISAMLMQVILLFHKAVFIARLGSEIRLFPKFSKVLSNKFKAKLSKFFIDRYSLIIYNIGAF